MYRERGREEERSKVQVTEVANPVKHESSSLRILDVQPPPLLSQLDAGSQPWPPPAPGSTPGGTVTSPASVPSGPDGPNARGGGDTTVYSSPGHSMRLRAAQLCDLL